MTLSSLYLVYGREADAVNEALHEPVSFMSGLYFPMTSVSFLSVLHAVALLIPLTIGMDALRLTLFNDSGLDIIWPHLVALAAIGLGLLWASSKSLNILEEKGRRVGTIAVRQR
jgi:ABC-2 type transport system permease protein